MVKVLIKKLSKDIDIPHYTTAGASGIDLMADINEELVINPGEKHLISTGIAIAIPYGYEMQIRPRSGLATKNGITVLNTPGTIDSDYRGEIKIILINHGKKDFIVKKAMRVAQLVIAKIEKIEWVEKKKLTTNTKRNESGFGSTGL